MLNYCEQVNITGIPEEHSCVTEKMGNIILGYQPAIRIEFLSGEKKENVIIEAVINDMPEEGFIRLLNETLIHMDSFGIRKSPVFNAYDGFKVVNKYLNKRFQTASFKLRDKNNKTCGGFDLCYGKYSLTIEKQEMPASVAYNFLLAVKDTRWLLKGKMGNEMLFM